MGGTRDAMLVSGPKRGEVVTVSRSPMEVWTKSTGDWSDGSPDEAVETSREFWHLRQFRVGDRMFWVLVPDPSSRRAWLDDAALALIDATPETVRAVEVPQ